MTMNTFILRPAINQDLHFCMNLHHKAYKVYIAMIWGWDEEKQNTMFRDDFSPTRTWIISLGKQDIGYYEINEDAENIHVCNLIIDQNYQGIGIGSSVLDSILEASKMKNKSTRLGVFKMNQRAMKFYRRLGFKVIEETQTHYMMKHDN